MKKEYEFPSADGKSRIYAARWIPEEESLKGILQIAHGMVEHIGRYEEFARYLASKGYLVVGHDHIGHGNSVKTSADWGWLPPENGDEVMVEDIHRHRLMAREEYPGVPYFMLGHSMGSYVLRKYLAEYGKGLAGAIIMGTGAVSGPAARGGIAVCKALAIAKGWRYRSPLVTKLTFGKNYKGYDLTGKDPDNSWLSRDRSQVEKNLQDPACRYIFTLGGYAGLFRTVLFCGKQKNVAAISPSLPILLVSGSEDPVGAHGKGVRKVQAMFEKAGSRDLTFRLYEGDRHEILNELDRQQVYRDLKEWMDRQIR